MNQAPERRLIQARRARRAATRRDHPAAGETADRPRASARRKEPTTTTSRPAPASMDGWSEVGDALFPKNQ